MLNTQQGGLEVYSACKFDMDNNFKSTSFLPSFISVKLIFRVSGQILRLLSRVTYLVSSQLAKCCNMLLGNMETV